MTIAEFLQEIWPSKGIRCLATYPHTSKASGEAIFHHHTFAHIDEAARFAADRCGRTNVFFGVHSFSDVRRAKTTDGRLIERFERKAENAAFIRCFYLDLDVSEGNPDTHASQLEAVEALIRFRKVIGFPPPMVVSSGRGLHAYWPMNEDVPSDLWLPHASKLKRLTIYHRLKADDQVTTDRSRVLRPVGTDNRKNPENPLPVELLTKGGPSTAFEDLVARLDRAIAALPVSEAPNTPAGTFRIAALPETSENVAIVEDMLGAIPPDTNRNEWLRVVFAVLATSWECAGKLARGWSMKGAKWNEAEFASLVQSFKPDGGIGLGTLNHIARQYGYTGPRLVTANAGDKEWPEPKPFPSGLLPVEPFDPDMVPKAVAPWIMDVAERMQCPPDFVAIPVLVALGAVLGRRVAIRPQRHTDWFEVPNLWGCIVGRPGAMKSPAMSEALRPLDRLETEARRSNAEALSHHSQAVAEHKIRQDTAMKTARSKAKDGGDLSGLFDFNPPDEPRLKRFKCNDTTYEALGVILANNPNGVLVFRDELVSLLKTLDREDNAAARGFYLTSWNGTSGYTFDRIMRGLTHIDAACISLLGSTQPGKLAAYVGRALGGGEGDDGLMQRFSLLVWPDDDTPWREVDRFPNSAAKVAAFAAFARLDALTAADVGAEPDDFDALPYLRLDDAAADLFAGWRADLETRLRDGNMHPALVSHLSKYRKLVPALALLNHLVDGGIGSVTQDAVRRALMLAGYLESHARRAYGSGRQAEVGAAKVLLTRIRRGDLAGEFSARDVLRHGWSNLSEKDQVAAGLDLLEDLGWLRSRRIDTGGRPKMMFNPNPRAASAPQAVG